MNQLGKQVILWWYCVSSKTSSCWLKLFLFEWYFCQENWGSKSRKWEVDLGNKIQRPKERTFDFEEKNPQLKATAKLIIFKKITIFNIILFIKRFSSF